MARSRKTSRYSSYSSFPEYVSVAERRAQAMAEVKKRASRGEKLQPVATTGRLIARSAWGRGWCEHLEKFHDYFNRLERGRRYVRNGSVIHLEINSGEVRAMVSGSKIYNVSIPIQPISGKCWQQIVKKCSGEVASWLDLLAGRFSDGVMAVLADPVHGLFPGRKEVAMHCSCPDGAVMCKHVAAVLYGIGARLDVEPEMLFRLRQVDASELLSATMQSDELVGTGEPMGQVLAEGEDASFADLFGIEIDMAPPALKRGPGRPPKSTAKTAKTAKTSTQKIKRGPGRPPKNANIVKAPLQAAALAKPVKRRRGRPSAEDIKKMFPVVCTADMLVMGFSKTDVARFLRNGLLKKHARGRYQTTMLLEKYRDY